MGIWVGSMFVLLWIVLQWIYTCIYLYNCIMDSPLGIQSVMRLRDQMIFLVLHLWGITVSPTMLELLYIPTKSIKVFLFLHSLISICCFSVFNITIMTGMRWSHCGFDLHFSNDQWCWVLYYKFVGHINVLFWKVSVHVLHSLLMRLFVLFL